MRVGRQSRHRWIASALALALLAAGCSGGDDSPSAVPSAEARPTATTAPTTTEPDLPPYEDPDDWLCHPDLDDTPCTDEVTVTAYDNEGGSRREPEPTSADPGVDCLYVHPTIGEDAGENGDLKPGGGEISITTEQAAPLTTVCRVFAPIFREATFHTLEVDDVDQRFADVAYGDIETAFRAYLAKWNDGRPFIVIGHSQGSTLLERLLGSVIAADPALTGRLVGAYLLGMSLPVDPAGVLSGAPTFALCQTEGQRGCVVSFSSYDVAAPPADDALFGHPWTAVDAKVACTNPAGLATERATLRPLVERSRAATTDARAKSINTTFVTYRDRFSSRCVDDGTNVYLEITNDPDPSSPEVEPIETKDEPKWGLHSIEVSLVLGSLLDLMRAQIAAA